jgi:hypothetical protein
MGRHLVGEQLRHLVLDRRLPMVKREIGPIDGIPASLPPESATEFAVLLRADSLAKR